MFRLASRKAAYRAGEMISLDLAMLNKSDTPVFSKQPTALTVSLIAHSANGAEVKVSEFTVYQLGVSTNLYTLLSPNAIITGSLNLLVGCGEQSEFMKARNRLLNGGSQETKSVGDREVFECDLFISWGDACLDTIRPGTYSVVAEIRNEHVIGSPCEPNVKTAVGSIRSTPLRITITE
jgi:hypothetical protein